MRTVVLLFFSVASLLPSSSWAGKGCRAFEELAEISSDRRVGEYARKKCRHACSDDDAEEIFSRFARKRDSIDDNLRGRNSLRRHNDEALSIVDQLGLSKKQQRLLHDEITKQHLNRTEILERAQDLMR